VSSSFFQVLPIALAATLTLGGCSGDNKPVATSPTADAQSDAKKAAPAADGGAQAQAAPEPGEKKKVVDGAPPGGDDRYALSIDTPEAKAGERTQVVVRVVPKAPWHMNLDFPTSLEVAVPSGVEVANASLKKADATKLDEDQAQFDVQFTAAEAGEKAFTGTFKFAVCQDDACAPVTENVEFKVAVR
jgi:hypothetical protein